jgi:hypothetical protein
MQDEPRAWSPAWTPLLTVIQPMINAVSLLSVDQQCLEKCCGASALLSQVAMSIAVHTYW